MKARIFGTTLTIVLLNAVMALAQSAPVLPGAPSQAPIDGGLSILAAAGVSYAMYKLKNRHKE